MNSVPHVSLRISYVERWIWGKRVEIEVPRGIEGYMANVAGSYVVIRYGRIMLESRSTRSRGRPEVSSRFLNTFYFDSEVRSLPPYAYMVFRYKRPSTYCACVDMSATS